MSNSEDTTFSAVLKLVLWFAVFLFVILRGGFVDQREAVTALESMGFTNVKVREEHTVFVGFRGCDQTDAVIFESTATNPQGKVVNMIVCAGWPFKGKTVRVP